MHVIITSIVSKLGLINGSAERMVSLVRNASPKNQSELLELTGHRSGILPDEQDQEEGG